MFLLELIDDVANAHAGGKGQEWSRDLLEGRLPVSKGVDLIQSGLDEPKGLDVSESLEQYYGSEIRHGRLYPNLDTLVEKGLVKKGSHDLRTNKYTLTDRGTREIAARLEWELSYIPDAIKSEADTTTTEA